MRWVDVARARLRLLLFGEEVEQRVDEEFRFHLDMETERLVREAGVDPREARRRARAHFGSVEAQKDAGRDARRGWAWLSGLQLGRDVRDGVRSLARRPAFTAVAVLSLALGIGANSAIFSLVNAVILRDSPIERPEEVVNLYLHQAAFEFGSLSYPDFEDIRDGTAGVFSAIAASHFVPLTIDRGEGGGVGLAPAEAVTGSYFPMLGIEAAVGRTLLPSDDVSRGGHPVVMLDHRYWQSAFAGDPDVVGREMRVGGRAYTVIGVGPADFAGTVRGLAPTFYVPYMMAEELNGFPVFDDRGQTSLFVKARLRPGVTLPQAGGAVGAVAAQLTRDRMENWDPAGRFVLLPLTEVLLFPPMDAFIRAAAWLLMVVVGLVLLLACTNLASFLLARALDRRKEVAVRLALGASRGSLVRRFLTETTLLSLLAGGAGVGLAVWLLDLLVTADLPLPAPVTLDLRLDGNVLGFTFGVSVVAGALLGLVPALQSTRPDVAGALRSENAGGGQPGQLRWRNALVVTQLTISLVLLVGAGLFLRSLQQVQSVDPGFGREPTAILSFLTPATRFTPDAARVYTRRLLDRFRALPGVEAVGAISNLHLNPLSQRSSDFNVDGFVPPTDHGAFLADRAEVEPGFFAAAGIEIVRGRNFNDADRPDTQPVVIVSEAMSRRFWADGDAVGRLVRRRGPDPPWLVVGVASDAKVRQLGESPRNMIYLPYSQRFTPSLTVVARTSIDPERTALALLTAGRELDPDLRVVETKTMDRHLALMRLPQQLSAFVLSAFGVLALALAAVGLYGLVSYSVARRTREIGIRKALGADGPRLVRLLVAGGLKLVVLGGALGVALAVVATRLLSGLLFEVDALDPLTFVGVPLVLGAAALFAAWLPARRASRVSPVVALRTD
ncbi:MAG: ABC transporter permease [Acidobacteria bacterium]|nr:ABC transporter permease [Acidobacteriota bacterium]